MENNSNIKEYIVEIKNGLYVARAIFGNTYTFTKKLNNAFKTSDLDSAKDIAEHCYGTVKEYKMKHELFEVIE